MRILAFDPGTLDAGAAVLEGGQLVGAYWLRPQPPAVEGCDYCRRRHLDCEHAGGPAMRHAMVMELITAAGDLGDFGLVVVEGQYIPSVRGINPAPLLELAQVVGAVCALASAAGVPKVLTFKPRDWKGIMDKAVFQTRILAALHPDELALVPRAPRTLKYLSDAVDAVGLALFAADRLDRWHTSPASFAELVEVVPARGKRRATKIGAGKGLASQAAQGGLALGTVAR